MKRNNVIVIGAVAVVAIIALWYVFLYSPLNDDLSSAQAETATAQKQTQDLQATLAQLQSVKNSLPEKQALLNKLDKAVPKNPDLAEFIVQANDIADQAGIEFLSIAPGTPAAGTGGVSQISLTITLSGSFFQLQDYLQSLESLDRLVVIDALNVAGSSASAGSGDAATSSGTTLAVTLTGKMFTRAAPTAGGAGGTTTPGASTSTTTTPAGSTSSTSAPAGSSTTTGGT